MSNTWSSKNFEWKYCWAYSINKRSQRASSKLCVAMVKRQSLKAVFSNFIRHYMMSTNARTVEDSAIRGIHFLCIGGGFKNKVGLTYLKKQCEDHRKVWLCLCRCFFLWQCHGWFIITSKFSNIFLKSNTVYFVRQNSILLLMETIKFWFGLSQCLTSYFNFKHPDKKVQQ